MNLKIKIVTGVLLSFLSASSVAFPRSPDQTSTPPSTWRGRPGALEEKVAPENTSRHYNNKASTRTATSPSPLLAPSTRAWRAGEIPSPSGQHANGSEISKIPPISSPAEEHAAHNFTDTLVLDTTEATTGKLALLGSVIEEGETNESTIAIPDSLNAKDHAVHVEITPPTLNKPSIKPTRPFINDFSKNISNFLIAGNFSLHDAKRSVSAVPITSFLNTTTGSSVEFTSSREYASDFTNIKTASSQTTTIVDNNNVTEALPSDSIQDSLTGRESDGGLVKTSDATSSVSSSEGSVGQSYSNFSNEFRGHDADTRDNGDDISTQSVVAPVNQEITTDQDERSFSESLQTSTSSSAEHNPEDWQLVTSSDVSPVPVTTFRTPQGFPFQPHVNESLKRSVLNYSEFLGEKEPGYYEDDKNQARTTETFNFKPIGTRTDLYNGGNGDRSQEETLIITSQPESKEEKVSHFSMKEDSMISEHNGKSVDILGEYPSVSELPSSRRIDSLEEKRNSVYVYSNVETAGSSDVKPHDYVSEHPAISSFPIDDLPRVSLPAILNKHDDTTDVHFGPHPHLSENSNPLFDEDEHTNFSYPLRDLDLSNAQETPSPVKFDTINSTEAPTRPLDFFFNISKNSDTFETPLGPMTRQDTKTMLYLLFFVCGVLVVGLVVLLVYWVKAKLDVRRLDMEMRRACLQGLEHRYVGRVE